jgi:methylmalonyl-CoA mutase N-terminal domain/subunit
VSGYDEQLGIPTQEAVVTSMRIQQVIAYETGIADVVDPLAGSYFIESLTSEVEERIWNELESIDELGGFMRCVETGYPQRVIASDAYNWQKAFEEKKRLRVGVNCFTSEEETRPARIYRANPDFEKQRVTEIRELRAKRNSRKTRRCLEELKALAILEPTAQNNLMPAVIEAVDAYATVGEICDVLREVWGEYVETGVFL